MNAYNVTSEKKASPEFYVYRRRWAVLITVVLLCMSNGFIWLSFFPVATTTANYFEKEVAQINWFSIVFMVVPALCFPPTTYLSHTKGLRFLVLTGCIFNLCGAAIKALATSPLIDDKSTQYAVCLAGQSVAAVAQTFSIYIPTKVSQLWFPDRQRPIATTILSLGYSCGITLTQLIVPFVVNENEQTIPIINYVALAIALAVQILALLAVTSSRPKTPPSQSAGSQSQSSISYLSQLKSLGSNRPFKIYAICIGVGIGYLAGFNTLTQQVACTMGYSQKLAGSLLCILYTSGFVFAAILQAIPKKTSHLEHIVKMLLAMSALASIMMGIVLNYPNIAWLIMLSFSLYGVFTVSVLPLIFEMSVEVTYPIDETTTIGMAYFIGQFVAIIMIFLGPLLAVEIESSSVSICDLNSGEKDKDYSSKFG